MSRFRKPVFWALALAVLALSLAPQDVPVPSTGWDKSNHLLGYSVLALAGVLAYPLRELRVVSGLVAYGGLIELLQSFTGYRFAEWLDLLANTIGILLGWAIWSLWCRFAAGRPSVICAGALTREGRQ